MQINVFKQLKKPSTLSIFVLSSTAFFALQYYILSTLPGGGIDACVIGGGLNAQNLTFAALMSVGFGLILAAIPQVYALHKANAGTLGGTSFMAFFIGIFTVFCTVCTIPLISVFGISFSLAFFTDAALELQLISLILMGLSLYLMEKQLKGICGI